LFEVTEGKGVSTAQVVAALSVLRGGPAIPKRQQGNASVAHAAAVKWTQCRPPGGVVGLLRKSLPFDPRDRENDWQFDIDVLVGHHLKE
jgi:hypothetical protein